MRRAVLLLGMLGACFETEPTIYEPPDPLAPPPPTPVTVHWKLQTAAGVPQPCPAGYDMVRVKVHYLRSSHENWTDAACTAGQADVIVRPGEARDTPSMSVAVRNATEEIWAEVPAGAPTTGMHEDVSVTIITDRGRLDVRWRLTRGGMPATCQEVGIDHVQVSATTVDGATSTVDGDCAFGGAYFDSLPTGPAHIEIVAGTITKTVDADVPPGGRTTEIPTQTLDFP